MPEAAYTSLALVLRYFFCAAILYILLRLVLQSLNEYREIERVKSQVAGSYASAISFLDPMELRGVKYALLKENTIGRGKKCSIRLLYKGVKRRQGSIYKSGASIYFHTRRKKGVYLNGSPVAARRIQLAGGDVVEIRGVRFQLVLQEAVRTENTPVPAGKAEVDKADA